MEKIIKILEESGWEEGRKVNLDGIKKFYEGAGYKLNELQERFIEQYAFLEIKYIHPKWNQEIILLLNPIEANSHITNDIIEDYEEFLDDSLLIIGEIDRENMTLFLGKSGEIYGTYDDCIIKWGNDLKKMLYNLVNGNKGEMFIMD